jgi:opacity protein-like surface antigen
MKKILLTTAAAAVLASSSAFAMDGDTFYAKVHADWSKMAKSNGASSKNDLLAGIGAGYYVMDNARVDLTFDHFFNPNHKKDKVTYKGTVDSLLLNGFFDMIDAGPAKVFVGVGVGGARVKTKSTDSTTGTSVNYTAKQKTNLAFAGYLGASTELASGINGELVYSYRDMGKTKKFGAAGAQKSVHYRGHNIGLGVRFDI